MLAFDKFSFSVNNETLSLEGRIFSTGQWKVEVLAFIASKELTLIQLGMRHINHSLMF